MENLVKAIIDLLGGIPSELIIFIISLFPILELRGGLIAASILHVDMWKAIPICIAGNILPIPFILLFIEKIFEWLKNTKLVKMIDLLEVKAEKNAKKIMEHKNLGLLLFVGVPLPGTGAWTGSLVAALFHFKLKDASLSILGGIIMATVIMCLISYGIPYLISMI